MTSPAIVVESATERAFDYDALDMETRIVVQLRTSEIKERIQRSASSIIEIGARLSEVRAKLEGSSFEGWLKSEFDWSRRTAYNFIGVHEQFGRANFAQLDIAASALYLLAAPSTPPEAREAALTRAQAGQKITHRDARALIGEHAPPERQVSFEEVEIVPAPPPLPLPAAPEELTARGWSFRRSPTGALYMVNDQHGGATAFCASPDEAVLAARDLDRRLASPPTPAAPPAMQVPLLDEEIAAAAPAPTLTPLAATPLLTPLTPLTPAASDDQALIQAAAKLLYVRKLVALAQREWDALIQPHLDRQMLPVVALDEAHAEQAARLFLASPALRAQAGMLTFGATVAMQPWDMEAA